MLYALDDIGYTESLLCYIEEATMDEMDIYSSDVYVTCEYFSISEIAYYCVMAAADQVMYGLDPQAYELTPYSPR